MAKKTFIRRADHGKENPYFLFLRDTAQDRELSYEARGVLGYILSKPDTWKVQPSDLITPKCGRDKVYRILKELREARYIEREQSFDAKHRIVWGDYIVYEQPCSGNPDAGKPEMEHGEYPLPGNPDAAFPYREKPDIREYRDLESTEEESTEGIQKPIAPNGAAGEISPGEDFVGEEATGPVFDKGRVFDCVAWAAFQIKDMRDLKPVIVKGEKKDNPAGARIGKIAAWLKKLYVGKPEQYAATQVISFYHQWRGRRNYNIPRDLEKFIDEWLAWMQEGLPDPVLTSDVASTETPTDEPLLR